MKPNVFFPVPTTDVDTARALLDVQIQLADLKRQEAFLKDSLKAGGARTIELDDDYRVTVTEASEKLVAVTDWEAVAKKLNPSRQLVTAHTSDKLRRTAASVRVYGPKT